MMTFDNSQAIMAAIKLFRCPNGISFWNSSKSGWETRFTFSEIFEKKCYEQHGVVIKNGDVILDIGAHIGLFSISLMERFQRLKITCVEPSPTTHTCLARNLEKSPRRDDHEVKLLACAIGSHASKAEITYYPRSPSNSTLHSLEKEQEWLPLVDKFPAPMVQSIHWLLGLVPPRTFAFFMKKVMRRLLNGATTFPCDILTISDLISQNGLQRINLLKIDIEGSEMEALQGIKEEDWPKIQQVVVEVGPKHKSAMKALSNKLKSIGFNSVKTEKSFDGGSVVDDDPVHCILYAVR